MSVYGQLKDVRTFIENALLERMALGEIIEFETEVISDDYKINIYLIPRVTLTHIKVDLKIARTLSKESKNDLC